MDIASFVCSIGPGSAGLSISTFSNSSFKVPLLDSLKDYDPSPSTESQTILKEAWDDLQNSVSSCEEMELAISGLCLSNFCCSRRPLLRNDGWKLLELHIFLKCSVKCLKFQAAPSKLPLRQWKLLMPD